MRRPWVLRRVLKHQVGCRCALNQSLRSHREHYLISAQVAIHRVFEISENLLVNLTQYGYDTALLSARR